MKNNLKILLCAAAATVSLSACSGAGFVPDSQAPRPYVAAHDIIDGQCDHIRLVPDRNSPVGRALPKTTHAVECPQENGGVEDAGGVQATDIR